MVQFFQSSADPRDAAYGQLASALGQGLGEGINNYYMNKALDDVLNDKSLSDAPISAKMGKLESALRPYGEKGQEAFKNRLMVEQQADQEKKQALQNQQGSVVGKILNGQPVTEKERSILSPEQNLALAKHKQAIELQELKNEGKAPLGGISGQPIPKDQIEKIDKFLKENPNATSNEMAIGLGKAGVNPKYSEEYIQNARDNEKISSKTNETKNTALRSETFPLKQELAKKSMAAQHGIQNKKQLLNLIKKGDIDDPTYAAFAEALPFNMGKRLLSDDTVEYKAGLVEEFGDLKNLFTGATRVKELDILQEKIADLYLTDDQKEAILNSRINALQADIILADVAADMEEEGINYPLLTYQKELEKRAKPRMDALFNKIIDEQNFVIKDAENKKKIPLNINDPDDKNIIQQILKEAGGDPKKAEQLAKHKGYHW